MPPFQGKMHALARISWRARTPSSSSAPPRPLAGEAPAGPARGRTRSPPRSSPAPPEAPSGQDAATSVRPVPAPTTPQIQPRAHSPEEAASAGPAARYLTGDRADAPRLAGYRRGDRSGAIGAAATAGTRQQALRRLRDAHFSSTVTNRDTLLKTWEDFHKEWFSHRSEGPGGSVPVFPLTDESIEAVAAMMKEGGYRSFDQYMSRAKDKHVEMGFAWTDILDRARKLASRAANRGLGPAHQAAAFPLPALMALELDEAALARGGPAAPGRVVEAGSFFCCREVEISLALRQHITADREAPSVTWLLPSTNNDPRALGKSRTWPCVCGHPRPLTRSMPCACCATHRQLDFLDSRGWTDPSTPLFPTETGGTATKEAVVKTFEAIASKLGLPIVDQGGYRLWGGHSLRVTGAQWLASQGVSIAVIQLVARWNSDVVFRYVSEAPLLTLADEYRRAHAAHLVHERFAAAQRTIGELGQQLGAMKDRVANMSSQEQEVLAFIKQCQETRDRRGPLFVVSDSNVHHIPDTCRFVDLPIFKWKARCGWNFGLSDFSYAESAPPDLRCKKCMRTSAC
ncbi:unnamed protein product [Prorocentrum cordatum]|uniref:Uncharacterized protein n=1 Tax=Prorocentrum cordatum TaxID=2364126 RepID=A0ABN9RTB5_9DINO|nr:unnamed protein product [Polarella glacialis]